MGLAAWIQPWGLTAADTKHDLAANPWGFLHNATHAYTDTFTLGQLQNQAYGYLFPQGLFFGLTEPLPDWVAQRLWWWLVLGVGFSGFYLLARRVTSASWGWASIGAVAFALSPRTMTTLTTISSETWPVMLAPWVLVSLLSRRLTWRQVAAAVVPVAAMGAVNATATMAACVPAAVILLWRREWLKGLGWLVGCALVSAWWLGPLIILGRYSPPFTEFIESSFVTTRWLNLAEALRGATSWAPFVDTERQAGTLIATEPVFVLVTMAVAAVGLAGLFRLPRVFTAMLLVGLALLCCDFAVYHQALDGSLAAMRNLHKFDPLVRIPLTLGLVEASKLRHKSAAVLVGVLVVLQAAPVWSGRMLPEGAYSQVPSYWREAADFINENAAGTRTLIYPPASFARQDWGWTRDEPAQPLLEVPWAVRDAIPLIDPEAIRGLDGLTNAMDRPDALRRLGIGAVIVRHDLEDASARRVPGERHTFGKVDVILLDSRPDVLLGGQPTRVAGGGESLAFLPGGPYELVADDAAVVTDTPALVDRNYGTLDGPVSAPMAPSDRSRVHNRLRDYPSAGPLTQVVEDGGQVVASSSAADADAFGGADPARSVTAAVDGHDETAWWPAPGEAGWIELRGDFAAPKLEITATEDTTVTVSSNEAAVDVALDAGEKKTISVPGGASQAVRVGLHGRVGIAELGIVGHPITRTVTVPDTSPNVQQFSFQRLTVDTGVLIRSFTAPRDMTVRVESDAAVRIDGADYSPGDTVELKQGQHLLDSRAHWARLTVPGFAAGQYQDSGREIAAAGGERTLVTGRAFNAGLHGFIGDQELEPQRVDAATQAFTVPAGVGGQFRMEFAADGAYRASLVGGGLLAAAVTIGCAWCGRRGSGLADLDERCPWLVLGLAAFGWLGVAAGTVAWVVSRVTSPTRVAACCVGIAGAMLARAPWPTAGYAGDSIIVGFLCALAIACLTLPRAGTSTSS